MPLWTWLRFFNPEWRWRRNVCAENKDSLGLSYSRKLQMMLCPRDIICYCLSLSIAMLPASCFLTPHLPTVFSHRQRHLPKLQRPTATDTEYLTLRYQRILEALMWPKKKKKDKKIWAQPLTLLATSCVLCCPLLPIYCQAINCESEDEGWQQG